jgi:hypothetical protein
MTDAWTLQRIEETRPDLAPLARLHRALADAARRVAAERAETLHPNFGGTPAIHWMAGRSLFEASNRAALVPAVAALFDALAVAAADAFPEARAAVDELRAATSRPGFAWPTLLVKFRDVPDEADVPHPALFRFLMLRAAAVPATHLAHAYSPPHAERWRVAACPY